LEPLRGRVQKVQKVLPASSRRVQRVWYRLTAMSMKSALRDFLLCLQCCIMESRSPLPQAEILQRISEPGSCVSIACTLSKHLKARPAGVAVRRRRIEASILGKKFGPILRASPSSIPVGQTKGRPFYGQAKGQHCPTWQSYAGLPPGEGACVTGVAFLLHKSR
jgi:hypothetical protein